MTAKRRAAAADGLVPGGSASGGAPGAGGLRTRGGWVPTGTAATRREKRTERTLAKGDETERRLLAAAREVFASNGYFDTRVEDIVAAVGVSRGTFYTYFADKRAVLDRILDELYDEMSVAVRLPAGRKRASPAEELRIANRRFLSVYAANASLVEVIGQVAATDPEVAARRDSIRKAHLSRIRRQVERWQRGGQADPDVDARTAAVTLVAMLNGMTRYLAVGEISEGFDWAVEAVSGMWERALGLDASG